MSENGDIASVRAVLVAWNPGSWLLRCTGSLIEEGLAPQQITIVDHGSTDDSTGNVLERFPKVRILRHPANRSFGEAVNLAASTAGGEFLFVLNPDVELRPGCLDALLGTMEGQQNVAVVGPRVLNEDGREVTRYSRTGALRAVVSILAPGTFAGWWGSMERLGIASKEMRNARFIEGCCMLIRRSAFGAVNGFDDDFTFFGEDADMCHRLRRLGYKLVHQSAAFCVHAGSHAFGIVPSRQRILFVDGILLFAWKHAPRRFVWIRRCMILAAWIRSRVDALRGGEKAIASASLLQRISSNACIPVMQPPKGSVSTFSVIIPTYDRPECLLTLLEALDQQTDHDFDVITIEQGNRVVYDELLRDREWSFALKRIPFGINNRAAAKNKGLSESVSDIVLFCDDDIIPPPQFIAVHRLHHTTKGIVGVSCAIDDPSQNVDVSSDFLSLTRYGEIIANCGSLRSGFTHAAACGNMSFQRSALRSVTGFDPAFRGTSNLEEFDVALRIARLNKAFWFDGSLRVKHVPQRGGNADSERGDRGSYYRSLHHNLMLTILKNRSRWTLPAVVAWAIARSVRQSARATSPTASMRLMIAGLLDGARTYYRLLW